MKLAEGLQPQRDEECNPLCMIIRLKVHDTNKALKFLNTMVVFILICIYVSI